MVINHLFVGYLDPSIEDRRGACLLEMLYSSVSSRVYRTLLRISHAIVPAYTFQRCFNAIKGYFNAYLPYCTYRLRHIRSRDRLAQREAFLYRPLHSPPPPPRSYTNSIYVNTTGYLHRYRIY